jgi:hypothetical protein
LQLPRNSFPQDDSSTNTGRHCRLAGHDSARFYGKSRDRKMQTRDSRVEETAMSTEKKIESKPEMTTPYRPLGLKAVVAAALMLNRKPKLTPAG